MAEAKRLVVAENMTYAQAAEATGVPVSTIQKTGAREDWMGQRQTRASYDATVGMLKAAALKKAMASMDPQDIYAWQAIEKAYPEHRRRSKDDPQVRMAVAVEIIEELVTFLGQNDRNALASVQPLIQPFAAHLEGKWAA